MFRSSFRSSNVLIAGLNAQPPSTISMHVSAEIITASRHGIPSINAAVQNPAADAASNRIRRPQPFGQCGRHIASATPLTGHNRFGSSTRPSTTKPSSVANKVPSHACGMPLLSSAPATPRAFSLTGSAGSDIARTARICCDKRMEGRSLSSSHNGTCRLRLRSMAADLTVCPITNHPMNRDE